MSLHCPLFKKCMNKFDCLVHEMLLIRELTPSLKVSPSRTQFKQNYMNLRDIAYYVITKCVNLQ